MSTAVWVLLIAFALTDAIPQTDARPAEATNLPSAEKYWQTLPGLFQVDTAETKKRRSVGEDSKRAVDAGGKLTETEAAKESDKDSGEKKERCRGEWCSDGKEEANGGRKALGLTKSLGKECNGSIDKCEEESSDAGNVETKVEAKNGTTKRLTIFKTEDKSQVPTGVFVSCNSGSNGQSEGMKVAGLAGGEGGNKNIVGLKGIPHGGVHSEHGHSIELNERPQFAGAHVGGHSYSEGIIDGGGILGLPHAEFAHSYALQEPNGRPHDGPNFGGGYIDGKGILQGTGYNGKPFQLAEGHHGHHTEWGHSYGHQDPSRRPQSGRLNDVSPNDGGYIDGRLEEGRGNYGKPIKIVGGHHGEHTEWGHSYGHHEPIGSPQFTGIKDGDRTLGGDYFDLELLEKLGFGGRHPEGVHSKPQIVYGRRPVLGGITDADRMHGKFFDRKIEDEGIRYDEGPESMVGYPAHARDTEIAELGRSKDGGHIEQHLNRKEVHERFEQQGRHPGHLGPAHIYSHPALGLNGRLKLGGLKDPHGKNENNSELRWKYHERIDGTTGLKDPKIAGTWDRKTGRVLVFSEDPELGARRKVYQIHEVDHPEHLEASLGFTGGSDIRSTHQERHPRKETRSENGGRNGFQEIDTRIHDAAVLNGILEVKETLGASPSLRMGVPSSSGYDNTKPKHIGTGTNHKGDDFSSEEFDDRRWYDGNTNSERVGNKQVLPNGKASHVEHSPHKYEEYRTSHQNGYDTMYQRAQPDNYYRY